MSDKIAILVLGMHRSGTSAVSALVSCFGADLGKTLMPAKAQNPIGFFENQLLIDLNDEILQFIGCRWDIPSIDDFNVHFDSVVAAFSARAASILDREFDHDLIAIKDPRLALLLPFWKHCLKQAGYLTRIVYVIRNPLDVIASLESRNNFSALHAQTLWLDSTLDTLRNLADEPDAFVCNYQDLFTRSEQLVTHLGEFLNVPSRDSKNVLTRFSSEYFSADLRHHHSKASSDECLTNNLYQKLSDSTQSNVLNAPTIKHLNNWIDEHALPLEHLHNKVRIYITAIASLGGHRPIEPDMALSRGNLNFLFKQAYTISSELKLSWAKNTQLKAKLTEQAQSNTLTIEALTQQIHSHKVQEKNLQTQISDLSETLDNLAYWKEQAQLFEGKYKREQTDKAWFMRKYAEEQNVSSLLKQANQKLDLEHFQISVRSTQLRLGLLRLSKACKALIDANTKSKRWHFEAATLPAFNIFRSRKKQSLSPIETLTQELESSDAILATQTDEARTALAKIDAPIDLSTLKQQHTERSLDKLEQFINRNERIVFPDSRNAQVTILIILFNRAELTLLCLESIIRNCTSACYKVIIVDNNSTDRTHELLDRIDGAEIRRNKENLGFLLACNAVTQDINTPYTLFLNNDSELYSGSIESALQTIQTDQNIGAVGGKIILLNGKLQEAGSMVYADGSCAGYGRDCSPDDFEYLFQRDVDFVSGAFLLTQTHLLQSLNGFDEQYLPAYYEDSDYCLNLSKLGFRTVYDPMVNVLHYEYGSSEASDYSQQLMQINQRKFLAKHQDKLKTHYPPDPSFQLLARHNFDAFNGLRILYIDDRVPHGYFGSGFPRSNKIVNDLDMLGHRVTLLPLNFPDEETGQSAYSDISRSIEIASQIGRAKFCAFWAARKNVYDVVWVSRPHNFSFVEPLLRASKIRDDGPHNVKLIYDAEAIFADRGRHLEALGLQDKSYKGYEQELQSEINLVEKADVIVTVSERDKQVFLDHLASPKKIVACAHNLPLREQCATIEARKNLLFVGNLDANQSPNVDSLLWFYQFIWPKLTQQLSDLKLIVVGSNQASELKQINDPNIEFLGRVDDIQAFYDQARVFIAPTRYSAGIPIKILEATANGLPCVASNILIEQLGWTQGVHALTSTVDDPETFAKQCLRLLQSDQTWNTVQAQARSHYAKDCDPRTTLQQVSEILTGRPRNVSNSTRSKTTEATATK